MDILLIVIAVIAAIITFLIGNRIGYNSKKNEINICNDELLNERKNIEVDLKVLQQKKNETYDEYVKNKQMIEDSKENLRQELMLKRKLMETTYSNQEKEWQDKIHHVEEVYNNKLNELNQELETLLKTRSAAIEAARKEKEIAENPQLYKLPLSLDEIHDIEYLNSIKSKMRFPAVIGKVIWGSFIQKKINPFTTKILGNKIITGIYKITNQTTQECYIGQSVDVAKRWTDHIKCGVGAKEVSNTNKLYAAMQTDGIENFSFELLVECPKEDLNKQEKYFIELYQSNVLGYNSTSGNR